MEDRTNELKVGIFVIIGLAILTYIVFSIGGFKIFTPSYSIKIIFGFANGVEENAPVRLAGVNAGEVKIIRLFYDEKEKKTKVELTARIEKFARIEEDSQVFVNTLGLLGEKYIEILPGTKGARLLEEGDIMIGKDSVPTEKLTERGYELMADLKELSAKANAIMGRIERGEGTVGKLLKEEKIYNDLEAIVEDIKKHPWKLLHKPRETKEEKEDKRKR